MVNKTNSIAFKLIMISSLFTVSGGAQATIYKCVNAQAEVYYNDKPCSVTTIERKLKSAKDPKGGYIPPKFVTEKEKESLPGVVVGKVTGRTIDKDNKDGSDNTSKGSNTGGSNTAAQSQSSDSKKNSSQSSNASATSDSGNNTVSKSAMASKQKHLSNVIEIEPSS